MTLRPMTILFAAVTAGGWGGDGVFVWVDALLEINTEYRGHLLLAIQLIKSCGSMHMHCSSKAPRPALRAVSFSRALPCAPTATAASTVLLCSNIKGHEGLMGLV